MSDCPSDSDLHRYHAKELGAAEEARIPLRAGPLITCSPVARSGLSPKSRAAGAGEAKQARPGPSFELRTPT